MKRLIATTCLVASLSLPAAAQDSETEQGLTLMEQGARLMMRGLMSEIAPALDGLRGSVEEAGPVLGDLIREMGPGLVRFFGEVDDIRHYELPQFLPNGDIILRRKPDAPRYVPEAGPGEITL
jgi:hypothetical protein